MKRSLCRPALALIAVFAAVPTFAGASTDVRLLAPRAGETLRAGETAVLEWDADPRFLHAAEEWEAFLSLDGGRSWPFRITPHLDLDLRRMTWRVPELASPEARILLRFGDERNEVVVEMPQRFAIAAPISTYAEPTQLRLAGGEPALPGDQGVARWVEGTRRGGRLRPVASFAPSPDLASALRPGVLADFQPDEALPPAVGLPPREVRSNPPPAPLWSAAHLSPPPVRAVDLLLLLQRWNE